jgi:glycosyltransferase involved in cell wall biosynthesis
MLLKSGPKLIYVGGFQNHRGLITGIRAMGDIVSQTPEAKFVLVGDGHSERLCRELAKQLRIEDNILFTGRVRFPEIFEYISECDIGVIPHFRSAHTDTTLPNKLFDYMGIGKPVLVSNCIPLERIVREENCGLVFESGNHINFSEQAIKLLKNEKLRQEMGANGKKAIIRRYNWDFDKKILIDSINALV